MESFLGSNMMNTKLLTSSAKRSTLSADCNYDVEHIVSDQAAIAQHDCLQCRALFHIQAGT